MPEIDLGQFRFFHPVQVRYSDLGIHAHVSNARFLDWLDDARIHYRRRLGLSGDAGVILAESCIQYHAPVFYDSPVEAGVRVTRLGTKSIRYQHCIADRQSGTVYAGAEAVMVVYDYQAETTIPVPEDWRRRISEFEGL